MKHTSKLIKDFKALPSLKALKGEIVESIRMTLNELFEIHKEGFKLRAGAVWDCNSNLLLDEPYNGQVESVIYEVTLNTKKTPKKNQDKDFVYIRNREVLLSSFRLFAVHSITTINGKSVHTKEYLDTFSLYLNNFTERLAILADELVSTLKTEKENYSSSEDNVFVEILRILKIGMLNTLYHQTKEHGDIIFDNVVLTDCNSNIDCLLTDDDDYHDHSYSLSYNPIEDSVFINMSVNGHEEEDFYFIKKTDLDILNEKTVTPNGDSYDFTEEIAKIFDEAQRSVKLILASH